MPHRVSLFSLTCGLALSLAACIDDPTADGADEFGVAEADLITNFRPASAMARGMGLVGHRRNGVVVPKCSAAFLTNSWLLTETRCIESVPWGSQLVVTSAFDPAQPALITPNIANVQWATVAEKSGLSSNPDLAMIRLSQPLATGRDGDPTATSGFVRTIASAPIAAQTVMSCFGFSVSATGTLRLGERVLTVTAPGPKLAFPVGGGFVAESTDHGGACLNSATGGLLASLRFVDAQTLELFDLGASWLTRVQLPEVMAASAPAAARAIWPITESNTVSGRCMTSRYAGDAVWTEPCLPIWGQGYQQILLVDNGATDDVQLAHRGSNACVEANLVGYQLLPCAAAGTSARWRQTFRLYYLADGSVQILSPFQGKCMTEFANGSTKWVLPAPCNYNTTPTQKWFQGLGRR